MVREWAMVAKDRLFSGTFEQSKRIMSKRILTEEGAVIGLMSSMTLRKKCLIPFLDIIFLGLIFAVGVALPVFILNDTSSILSESTREFIYFIGQFTSPITQILIIIHFVLVMLNLFPKPNYAYQLLYGNVTLIILSITTTISVFPLTAGLTIAAFGWIGFLPQLLLCLYLWKLCVIDKCQQLRTAIYQESTTAPDWGSKLISFIKTYGGILLGLSILNRWTLNLGELVREKPGFLSFLYGWIFLFFMFLMLFAQIGRASCRERV